MSCPISGVFRNYPQYPGSPETTYLDLNCQGSTNESTATLKYSGYPDKTGYDYKKESFSCLKNSLGFSCKKALAFECSVKPHDVAETEKKVTNLELNLENNELLVTTTSYECISGQAPKTSFSVKEFDFLFDNKEVIQCGANYVGSNSVISKEGLTFYVSSTLKKGLSWLRFTSCKNGNVYLPFGFRGESWFNNEAEVYCSGERLHRFDEIIGFTAHDFGAILWGIDDYKGKPNSDMCAGPRPPEKSIKYKVLTEFGGAGDGTILLPNSDRINKVILVKVVDVKSLTIQVKITYDNLAIRTYEVNPYTPPKEVLD